MKEDYLPRYIGDIHPNSDYHHGQISPAKGVKCWQVSRANRTYPNMDDGSGYTYKHAPDLAYFEGSFYIQYLINPEDEHRGAGYSILAKSLDGKNWDDFMVSFPIYKIASSKIEDYKGNIHEFDGESYAYMHQRMSFYKSNSGRLLLLGFYGWSPEPWITNWDNYGIGRVVREIYKDGSLGEIYFIKPNWQAGWRLDDLNYPLYSESLDKGFVEACDELLNNSLYVQQWAEENGDSYDKIKIKHPEDGGTYQAFTWYHIDQDTIIGLWKHALTARSDDGGQNWSPLSRSSSLVMSGQKVWGAKTSDGRYAMVYNPTLETQHRYPLCLTSSEDGINFDNMLLVHGEVPEMRFKGFWKDLGPQYVRGIAEGLDQPPDGNLWVTYSVNKEDIWIASIPLPITGAEDRDNINEKFTSKSILENWNLYSPKWTNLAYKNIDGKSFFRLEDREPYDYARAERIFKASIKKSLNFEIIARQNDRGCLHIELLDGRGIVGLRLVFRDDGYLYARTVTELPVMEYEKDKLYKIRIDFDCEDFRYYLFVNDRPVFNDINKTGTWLFMSAVNSLSRFSLRTGNYRRSLGLDYDPEGKPEKPLENCDEMKEAVVFDILSFETKDLI